MKKYSRWLCAPIPRNLWYYPAFSAVFLGISLLSLAPEEPIIPSVSEEIIIPLGLGSHLVGSGLFLIFVSRLWSTLRRQFRADRAAAAERAATPARVVAIGRAALPVAAQDEAPEAPEPLVLPVAVAALPAAPIVPEPLFLPALPEAAPAAPVTRGVPAAAVALERLLKDAEKASAAPFGPAPRQRHDVGGYVHVTPPTKTPALVGPLAAFFDDLLAQCPGRGPSKEDAAPGAVQQDAKTAKRRGLRRSKDVESDRTFGFVVPMEAIRFVAPSEKPTYTVLTEQEISALGLVVHLPMRLMHSSDQADLLKEIYAALASDLRIVRAERPVPIKAEDEANAKLPHTVSFIFAVKDPRGSYAGHGTIVVDADGQLRTGIGTDRTHLTFVETTVEFPLARRVTSWDALRILQGGLAAAVIADAGNRFPEA